MSDQPICQQQPAHLRPDPDLVESVVLLLKKTLEVPFQTIALNGIFVRERRNKWSADAYGRNTILRPIAEYQVACKQMAYRGYKPIVAIQLALTGKLTAAGVWVVTRFHPNVVVDRVEARLEVPF